MSDVLLHVATRKGLFVVEGAGSEARVVGEHFVGDNVVLTLVDRRDGAWYAVLDHGHFGVKLHRSDDAGASWVEVGVPEYPAKPEGFVDIDMWGKDRDWALMGIWALEPALDREGALWCGTSPGGLFRSNDRGDTWEIVEVPPELAHRVYKGTAAAPRDGVVEFDISKIKAQLGYRDIVSPAEALASKRLAESEAITAFLTDVFQSPDPARGRIAAADGSSSSPRVRRRRASMIRRARRGSRRFPRAPAPASPR